MARNPALPPKLTEGGFALLSALMSGGYTGRVAIDQYNAAKFSFAKSGDTISASTVKKLVLDGYLIPSPAQRPLFYDLSPQALDLACPSCKGSGVTTTDQAGDVVTACPQCSGRKILAPGTDHTPPYSSKPKGSPTGRKTFKPPKLDRPKPASTLGAALDTLLNMPVKSFRPDLTPAKPGYYWAVFDDGRSFDSADWYGMPDIGAGPHIVKVEQEPEYGEWSAKMLEAGGHVEIGEDIANRRVRLAFPVTVVFSQSVAMQYVRVTWLGAAVAPDLPSEVEPMPEWL